MASSNKINSLQKLTGPLLRGAEVAKILNISRSFAYKLMSSGEIPIVRIGKSIRVRLEDLDNYIETNLEQ